MIFLVGLILIWQSSCKCDLNVTILNKNICFDTLFLISTRVHQGQRTVSSLLGGSVTLPCYFNMESPLRMFWFKHVPGHEIKPIVSSYYNQVSFEEEVNKSKLDAETSDKSFNLTLKSIEASDEGSYLCGVNWYSKFYFGNGVFLFIKVQIQQHYLLDPASEGHDLTLNCTVVSGGCAGEHSVYWFRHGTPGSHPGIIYTHGDRSAGCEKNPEAGSSTQSCVYHLPKRNLSTTDAGTYYCAVVACGQITIVSFNTFSEFLYEWYGASAFPSSFLTSFSSVFQCGDADSLNYAALSFTSHQKPKAKRREREEPDVLYARVGCSTVK
uniref:Ig-like domain-containing protein n=1 Tax=Denticeps clupeoides TaxID=299321 RepID=A0AAY4DCI6_9TELE